MPSLIWARRKNSSSLFWVLSKKWVVRGRLVHRRDGILADVQIRNVRTSLSRVQCKRHGGGGWDDVVHGHVVVVVSGTATAYSFPEPPDQRQHDCKQDESNDADGDPDAQLSAAQVTYNSRILSWDQCYTFYFAITRLQLFDFNHLIAKKWTIVKTTNHYESQQQLSKKVTWIWNS